MRSSDDEAVAVLDRVTDASIRQATALQRADALRRTGRLGEARILLDDLLLKTPGDESVVEQAVARAMEASMELDAGQPSAALLLARQSLAARPAPTYDAVRRPAWLIEVRSLDRLGRPDEARAAAKAFAAWAPSGNAEVQLTLQLALAERAAVDRQPSADRLYDEALAAATRWAVPASLADVAQSYGRYLLAQGDLARASTVIGRVSRHADQDFDSALLQARLYKALGNAAATDAAIAQARRLAGERSIPRDWPARSAPRRRRWNTILQVPRRSSGDPVASAVDCRRQKTDRHQVRHGTATKAPSSRLGKTGTGRLASRSAADRCGAFTPARTLLMTFRHALRLSLCLLVTAAAAHAGTPTEYTVTTASSVRRR